MRFLHGQHIVGALVVEKGLMSRLRREFVRLTSKVEGLCFARLHLQDQLEAILCMSLLVQMDIAASEEQVTVLDRLVDLRQILLKIGTRWLYRVKRFKGL